MNDELTDEQISYIAEFDGDFRALADHICEIWGNRGAALIDDGILRLSTGDDARNEQIVDSLKQNQFFWEFAYRWTQYAAHDTRYGFRI